MDGMKITKRLFNGFERTLATLVTYILSVVDSELAEQPSMQRSRGMVTAALDKLAKAIHRVRANEFTARVAAADAHRDQLQLAVKERVSSDMRCTYNPQIVKNATLLDRAIEQCGRSLKPGYFDQAEQIKALLEKFAEPSLVTAIDENNMRDLVDALSQAEDEFMEIWDMANRSNAEKEPIPPLRDAVNEVIDTVNNRLLTRLEIEALDGAAPFTTAVERIKKAIEKVENIQRARIAQNDTDDEPIDPAA